MTEKRFKNVGKDIFQYGEWWCSTNGEHCADVITTTINEFIEENEQLKYTLGAYRVDLNNHKYKCNALEEENKQLKNEIEKLSYANEDLLEEKRIWKQMSDEYTKLSDENEQLKEDLKRCRNWINSDKNDYELTLAFIKNKGYSLKDVLEYEKELKSE